MKKIFLTFNFLFFISLFFLFLVPIFGTEVKGSKRWLDLFFLPRFQPIELVKPFTIIFLATILSSEKNLIFTINILLVLLQYSNIFFINDAT